MTVTPVKPGLPIVPSPPIIGLLEVSEQHTPAMHTEFRRGGPTAALVRWAIPAKANGFAGFWLRQLAVEWPWLRSWVDAARNLGLWPLTLYANPAGWGLRQIDQIRALALPVVLDEGAGMGASKLPHAWVREALADAGLLTAVEPLIDLADPWAQRYPCVLASDGHDLPPTPAFQVAPDLAPGGCYRWYRQPSDPAWGAKEVLADVQAWYRNQRQPWCRGVIVGAGMTTDYGITAAMIRGQ